MVERTVARAAKGSLSNNGNSGTTSKTTLIKKRVYIQLTVINVTQESG